MSQMNCALLLTIEAEVTNHEFINQSLHIFDDQTSHRVVKTASNEIMELLGSEVIL